MSGLSRLAVAPGADRGLRHRAIGPMAPQAIGPRHQAITGVISK